MPIHFAAVGANGAAVTGTYRLLSGNSGFECQITAQTPDPEGMIAPVNIMYVDSKGEAALVVLRQNSDEPIRIPPPRSGSIPMRVYDEQRRRGSLKAARLRIKEK